MNAVILEDELFASKRLKRIVKEVAPDINIVATFETIRETAEFLKTNNTIDLLFLDIQVADGNSFELFGMLEIDCKVIFTTAYNEFAIEAFRKNATDYLLKPIKKEHLIEAINKATPYNNENDENENFKQRILIKFMSKMHSLKTSNIAFVYSKNKISYIYTKEGVRYPSDLKLQEIEDMLNPIYFFRANRQFIIHIDSLDQIYRFQGSRVKITLNPSIDEDIIISTDKTPLFKDWLKR